MSWASNWFRWFQGDPSDARCAMGWPGRYADALSRAGEVFNYYSTGDDTFEETPNPPWLLEGMDDSTSRYAWQKQETLKGSALPGGSLHGGWGFHQWRVSDPETLTWSNARFSEPYAAGLVATNAIPNCPVFDRGYSPMFDCDAAQEEVYEALAKHVPAISTAVGRCRALAVERNNVDLSSISYQNGRGRTPVENDRREWSGNNGT